MSTNTFMTVDQEKMVSLLIAGENISSIAKTLNVSRSAIYNWLDKDSIKLEIEKRKREIAEEGNRMIIKDLTKYIDNLKALANDRTDKRVCLAANQYLLNRIYGNPSSTIDLGENDNSDKDISETELENEILKFKKMKSKI